MDSSTWTEIGKISESETSGDVSAATELLCRGALKVRAGDDMMISDEATKVIDDHMNAHGFETWYLALQDLLLKFKEQRKPLGDLIGELDGSRDEHTRTES